MRELENKDWFFLGGDLYKKLGADRFKNQMKAFNYREQRPKVLVLSEVKRYKKPAFDARQVGIMLNRSKRTIIYYIENELYVPQGKSDRDDSTGTGKWWFSDDDVLNLRDVIYENCKTAKAPKRLPTREEVRAMTRTKKMLYVQQGDSFVPVYKAETW